MRLCAGGDSPCEARGAREDARHDRQVFVDSGAARSI